MASLTEIAQAAGTSAVRLTPHAHLLLKVVLDGITEDPHPGWTTKGTGQAPTPQDLVAQEQSMVSRLPDFLKNMSSYHTVRGGVVTSFDVIHWLRERLDNLCPFDK